MPKVKYKDISFSEDRRSVISQAVSIAADYRQQGYDLTLRQLYYRFVALDLFPADWKYINAGGNKWTRDPNGTNNAPPNYKLLGDVLGDARLAGLLDWHDLEDRTRKLQGNNHWGSPIEVIEATARQFKLDKWVGQKHRVEVWVEKDALSDVVGQASRAMDVDYFACKGYASLTAFWDAGQRLKGYADNGQIPVILHLGDHDPSGLDMSGDIQRRVAMFMDDQSEELIFHRIALNMPQIKRFKPPPNPAKTTDARFKKYQREYGDESWELDSLDPAVLDKLIRAEIRKFREEEKFSAIESEEDSHRENLRGVVNNWDEIVEHL